MAKAGFMRLLIPLLLFANLLAPCWAQQAFQAELGMGGFLVQTAITPESYLITNAQELQSFVTMLPKVTPFKTLPAPPNLDPFLKGYSPDFRDSILVVATGRDRITDPPRFQGLEILGNGTRLVRFVLPKRSTATYPYGWGVYTAVVLPRSASNTKVLVTNQELEEEDFKRGEFERANFQRIDSERADFKRAKFERAKFKGI